MKNHNSDPIDDLVREWRTVLDNDKKAAKKVAAFHRTAEAAFWISMAVAVLPLLLAITVIALYALFGGS